MNWLQLAHADKCMCTAILAAQCQAHLPFGWLPGERLAYCFSSQYGRVGLHPLSFKFEPLLCISAVHQLTVCLCMKGLSEPVGAATALLLVKPFLSEKFVHLMLAFVGGIMVSHLLGHIHVS